MTTAAASYSFNVTTTGKNHEITYSKAKLGFKTILPLLWPALPIGGFLAYKASSSFSGGIFLWIVFSIGLPIVAVILLNLLRTSGSFTVGEYGIIRNGITYSYKDINSFYIRTPKGEKSTTLVHNSNTGYGVTGAMNAAGSATVLVGDAAGRALRSSLREKNYKVCMIFGEKEIVLAGGLTDKTAKVLLEKIDTLL
jgi:hypothetical protein